MNLEGLNKKTFFKSLLLVSKKFQISFIVFILTLVLKSNLFSQSDTIFCKDNKTIIGKITLINDQNIFYEKKGTGDYIAITIVKFYSKGGKRQEAKPVNLNVADQQKNNTQSSQYYSKAPKVIDTILVSTELQHFKSCLESHTREYYTGVSCMAVGLTITTVGGILSAKEQSQANTATMIFGGVIALIGNIIIIDSHKWFKRAGLGVNGNGNSIGIYYKFK